MQMRCAQTSELIAEGTPLEIATLAAELDAADILFDDAGWVDADGKSLFDPAVVREIRAAEMTSLEAAIAELPVEADSDDPGVRERRRVLRDTLRERRDRIAAGREMRSVARQTMQDARARVDRNRRRG